MNAGYATLPASFLCSLHIFECSENCIVRHYTLSFTVIWKKEKRRIIFCEKQKNLVTFSLHSYFVLAGCFFCDGCWCIYDIAIASSYVRRTFWHLLSNSTVYTSHPFNTNAFLIADLKNDVSRFFYEFGQTHLSSIYGM